MTGAFTAEELADLKAFRRAAAQVRDASIIAEGQEISISAAVGLVGAVEQAHKLLGNEPFRSLAMSVRLVYMQGEPANYGHVCNVLRTRAPVELQPTVDLLRQRYNSLVNGKKVQFQLHGALEGQTVATKEVFEAWLYGASFHQDQSRQPVYEELLKFGSNFVFAVQLIALQLAGLLLDLDDVVAESLGEAPLPRI